MELLYEYYARYSEETRLTQDNIHRSEFLTTMHLLRRHLPPGCRVLDCCAGTGIYAFALAELEYRVTAGDLIEKHVTLMRQDARAPSLEGIYRGDVLDLSAFGDESFDAVLCLGALYHLQTDGERNRAVAECLRTLKGGGLFVFAYINPFVLYYRQLAEAVRQSDPARRIEAFRRLSAVQRDRRDGIFYGMTAEDAEALVARHRLAPVANAGAYSTLHPLSPELNALSEGEFVNYMECQLETCVDPDVARHSMHGLCIARK